MPYDKPEADDPHAIVGVGLPGGPEAAIEMAYTFAEEFVRLGHSEEEVISLFQNPFYRGVYDASRTLGEEEIRRIVRECVSVWGRIRWVVRDAVVKEGNPGPGRRRASQ